MKKVILALAVAIGLGIYSCKKQADTLTTTAYLDLPATPYNYQVSGSSNNVATLGRVLFYDTHLSLNNAISCGSCHKQAYGFGDNTAFSAGYEGRLTGRNSPGLNMVRSNGAFFWDGREQVLTNLIARPISNHIEMGIEDLNALPAKLNALPYYRSLFYKAYFDSTVTLNGISQAVAAFVQSIGIASLTQPRTLTAQEQNGQYLFDSKYNCGSCHRGGSGYSGSISFRDIGLDGSYTDKGRGALTGNAQEMGTFKVPNLTNVALTAPYMHDGRYKTLDEVLEHYSHGIANSANLDSLLMDATGHARQMQISDGEKKDIIAFLNTLTDYQTLTDPKFSNPFKVK